MIKLLKFTFFNVVMGLTDVTSDLATFFTLVEDHPLWANLTDTKPGASVTEKNILSFMGVYEVVSHTPHEHHHSDRIFGQRPKCDFFLFSLIFS